MWGHAHRAKHPPKTARAQGEDLGREGALHRPWQSHSLYRHYAFPTVMGVRMGGPQTPAQLPSPPGCKVRAWPESSRAPSTLHAAAGAEQARGTPVSPQSAGEQGVPCVG